MSLGELLELSRKNDELEARIAQLEAERETWGNEFNAVCAMKEQLRNASERVSELSKALNECRGDAQYLWAGWCRHGEWPPCLAEYIERILDTAIAALKQSREGT